MSDIRKKTGNYGEKLAVSFLLKNKYKVIETNFRTRFGEIDIVCKKNNQIIFVEVRTKTNVNFGAPEESVNRKKQEKLILMANQYLSAKKMLHSSFRIDGIFIVIEQDKTDIRHLENIINIL